MRGVLIALAALAAATAANAQTITVSSATQTSNQQQVAVTVSGRRRYHSSPDTVHAFKGLLCCKVRPLGCITLVLGEGIGFPDGPLLEVHLAL